MNAFLSFQAPTSSIRNSDLLCFKTHIFLAIFFDFHSKATRNSILQLSANNIRTQIPSFLRLSSYFRWFSNILSGEEWVVKYEDVSATAGIQRSHFSSAFKNVLNFSSRLENKFQLQCSSLPSNEAFQPRLKYFIATHSFFWQKSVAASDDSVNRNF